MSQTYFGEVQNGVIVLEPGSPPLPEGMKVQVAPVGPEQAVRDLSQILLDFAGSLEGLPEDMAAQHDHYLHGTPRR